MSPAASAPTTCSWSKRPRFRARRPRRMLSQALLLSLGLGLGAGVAAAFVLERLDDTVKTAG